MRNKAIGISVLCHKHNRQLKTYPMVNQLESGKVEIYVEPCQKCVDEAIKQGQLYELGRHIVKWKD